MRLTLIILLVALVAASCKKGSLASTNTVNEMVDTTAVLKYSGNFVSGPYGSVTGRAEVYKSGSSYEVKLVNFNTSNGPALHVYLAKEAMPVNFMDLGALKSTNGNQVYSVTGMPVFADYKYISIHCVAYNHLFGSALIN